MWLLNVHQGWLWGAFTHNLFFSYLDCLSNLNLCTWCKLLYGKCSFLNSFRCYQCVMLEAFCLFSWTHDSNRFFSFYHAFLVMTVTSEFLKIHKAVRFKSQWRVVWDDGWFPLPKSLLFVPFIYSISGWKSVCWMMRCENRHTGVIRILLHK